MRENKPTRIKFDINNPDLDIKIIELTLKRNRNVKILIGLLMMAFSCFMILVTLTELPTRTSFIVAVICMLIGFTGFYFLLSAVLRYDTQKNYLLKLITRHPEDVVWIYYKRLETMPFGIRFMQFTTLHIQLLNREQIVLQMGEQKIHQLMRLLRYRLPKATFGYSRLKEQLYSIAPDFLSK